MKTLFHDYETFSEVDIRTAGHWKYARHESTEVLMVAWQINNGDVYQIDWTVDNVVNNAIKADFIAMLHDPEYLKRAWNASFEYAITKYVLNEPVDIRQYRCTMVIAATLTLPMALAKCGEVIGLDKDDQKDAAGKNLIRLFSCPRTPSKTKPWTRTTKKHEPEKWDDYLSYNRQDVKTEFNIFCRLHKWDLPQWKWDLWHLDQEINEHGLPMDRELICNAIAVDASVKSRMLKEAKELTGLANPNSRDQMLGWLYDNGVRIPDLSKNRLESLLEEEPLDDHIQQAIYLRLQMSKTSVSKFKKALDCMDDNDRISGSLQFAGAQRTWRWGGRLIQPQNLPGRGVNDVPHVVDTLRNAPELFSFWFPNKEPEMLAGACRPMIRAPEGKKLVVADLNAIENRVLGPLTGCKKVIETFEKGLDPYKMFGVDLFGVPYEEITKWMRTQSKPGVLGGGYRLGGGEERFDKKKNEYYKTGLWGYAANMGIEMTQEMAQKSIDVFRAGHPEVVEFWDDIERAAKRCIRTGQPSEVNHYIRFEMEKPFLKMVLPSGRCCYYFQPRIEMKTPPWKGAKARPTICYTGYVEKGDGSTTRIWGTVTTHGGKLTENCIAEGTEVATHRGWVKIEEIRDTDFIFDGVEFVPHGGMVYKSEQATIDVCGVQMTPDHEVLTNEGWKAASEKPEPYGSDLWDAYRPASGEFGREEAEMGILMRMRDDLRKNGHGCEEGSETGWFTQLWMQHKKVAKSCADRPRHEYFAYIRRMAVHAGEVQPSIPSGLSQLWGERDSGLPPMVRFSNFLFGCGEYVSDWIILRSDKQRRELRAWEHPMGNHKGTKLKPSYESICANPEWENDIVRRIQEIRDSKIDSDLQKVERVARRQDAHETRYQESRVYDILGCGPRSRFVVRGSEGPFIVHNCDQAISADILGQGLVISKDMGFQPIMHVHDEIITLVDEDSPLGVPELCEAMSVTPEWMPDLPLASEGYEHEYYIKD